MFYDGQRQDGDVVERSPQADLALVQLRGSNSFTPLSMGDAASMRVGDEVVALGYPGLGGVGISLTATRGIVSAIRTVGEMSIIQTDAAINPGNSGGHWSTRMGGSLASIPPGSKRHQADGR